MFQLNAQEDVVTNIVKVGRALARACFERGNARDVKLFEQHPLGVPRYHHAPFAWQYRARVERVRCRHCVQQDVERGCIAHVPHATMPKDVHEWEVVVTCPITWAPLHHWCCRVALPCAW